MALNIPLPGAPTPEGDIFNALVKAKEASNAFNESQLKQKMQGLQNQYYAPNIESQIAERNALTKGYNISNQYAPEKNTLALENQKLINEYNRSHNPMELKKEQILLENLPASEQARIESQKAIANWRNSGGMQMGVAQKELLGLQRQLKVDHPDWDDIKVNQAASAYISGENTLPDGTPLPSPSGLVQTHVSQIHRRNSPVAIQTQAANMDVLANDVNDIDITPVTKFAGPQGKLDYAKNAFNMGRGLPVSQEFRDYLTFKDITSNFSMDALRKGFGTSVVPGYVYATLGKAANPNSTWWYDPEQVLQEWNKTRKWINDNAAKYKQKAKFGATADISGNKQMVQIRNKKTGEIKMVSLEEAKNLGAT